MLLDHVAWACQQVPIQTSTWVYPDQVELQTQQMGQVLREKVTEADPVHVASMPRRLYPVKQSDLKGKVGLLEDRNQDDH